MAGRPSTVFRVEGSLTSAGVSNPGIRKHLCQFQNLAPAQQLGVRQRAE